jgi:hypothetical protein
MFIDNKLSKINTKIFTDNYRKIKEDYLKFRDCNFFIDYSHEYDLTSANGEFPVGFSPTLTPEYYWKVCPLIFNRKIFNLSPNTCQECFTTKLLINQSIKPVLAVFSILESKAELEPHSDGDERIDPAYRQSSVIKFHFSLDIPSDGKCGLVVNNEQRILSNGDLNLFDEKLSLHYAYNRSENRRGVLIVSYIRDEVLMNGDNL